MAKLKPKPIKLKGIKRVKRAQADGSIIEHFYFRATGAKLQGRPGTPEFFDSYAKADKAMRTRSTGNLTDLIRRFDTSPYFDGLADATREAYVWKLRTIDKKWGSCPIEAVVEDDFGRDALAWRDQLAKKSLRSADNLLSALARVLSFAKENKLIKVNQLETFKRVYKNDRSEMVWSDSLVMRFLEVASPPMVTAMYLARNTGQRQKDIRELPWSAYDGTTIRLRASKSKSFVQVPCPKELKCYLDRLPRTGVLILNTKTGKAFTKRHFNECWREDADKAGAGELNFHDNRGTAATALAEAGATVPMIASVMGWTHDSAQKIIDRYVARSANLAAAGIELLEAHRLKITK